MTVSIVVTRVEFLGSECWAYGVLQDRLSSTRLVARLSIEAASSVKVGETQEFAVRHKELRFFDKATGLKTTPDPSQSL